VEPQLAAAIGELADELLPAIQYHFGWTDLKGLPSAADTGKRLRPALALLSAEAVGSETEIALPGAVAVELIHNFSLIHDDVIDGDKERHHRPTVWAAFGTDEALIAGDALHTLAFQVLLSGDSSFCMTAARRLAGATTAMIAGQAADMALDDQLLVTLDACLTMEAAKTGALLGYAASVGAVLAGGAQSAVDALDTHGRHLGLAYQAVDDILGIWGNPNLTGKPVGNDLRERKKSMPVAAVLSAGGPAAQELEAIYLCDGDLSEEEITRASCIIEEAGGREITLKKADHYLEAALEALESGNFTTSTLSEFEEVARFVVERDG
tara:strand:- start:429 stop:1400 length:972 start_codon:yes stop_codon:yes gene_type:complete